MVELEFASSYCSAAEDAEMELRMLLRSRILFYDRNIRVYHNRWLKPHGARVLAAVYTRGEAACYSYYMFGKYKFARAVMRQILRRHFKRTDNSLRDVITEQVSRKTIGTAYWSITTLMNLLFGVGIGWYFSATEHLGTTDRHAA